MEFERNEYFDLLILLELGDLNLRQVAEANPSLTVGELFAMLSKFTDTAPEVSDVLNKFTKLAAEHDNKQHWRHIENMILLLTNLESNIGIPELYAVSHARGQGDWRAAAFHAKKIVNEFNNLYTRIIAAKRTITADALSDAQGANNLSSIPDVTVTLKEYLGGLDYDETKHKLAQEILTVTSEKKAAYKPLILAVDDSPDVLAGVSALLSDSYRVLKLPKPGMLKNVLQQVTPDLFLLDYQMPELSGFDCIPIIRDIKGHEATPIIFLTSAGTVDNISTAIALGACDFIVKPFNPDALRKKIAKHIVKK